MNENREWTNVTRRLALALGLMTVFAPRALAEQKLDKIGLVIIAHGSRRVAWNETLRSLEPQVREALANDSASSVYAWDVKVCFLEECTPTIEETLAGFEREGCTRIVAVPLFVAQGEHVQVDIPQALGLVAGQDHTTNLPVILTGPLSTGTVMERWAASQVQSLSTAPEEEAVVLLAHGGHDPVSWERLLRRMASRVCGATGITYADWAIVQVGQSYQEHGVEAIRRALAHRPRVIVLGAYAALSAARIHQKWAPDIQFGPRVVFGRQGVLPNSHVPRWVVTTALAALPDTPVAK
jgi:sirohydrochlorin ferrochelatase